MIPPSIKFANGAILALFRDLVNLICLGDVSVNGMNSLNLERSRKIWLKYVIDKILKNGCEKWKNGFKKEVE